MSSSLEVGRLEAEAQQHMKSGRSDRALTLWAQALAIDPNNTRVLTSLGQHALRTGELKSAHTAFARVVAVDGSACSQWINLALACRLLNDDASEELAIHGALRADPSDLLALILRANLLEKKGKTHQAARVYGSVVANSPQLERLDPDLRPAVKRAMAYREKYDKEFSTFVDRYLEPTYESLAGENLSRFRDSLAIMTGRKKRYDARPAVYYYPQLAPIEFFERTEFSWLDAVESATDEIRQEFLELLNAEADFTPYLTYPDDVPHFQFAELNNSPRWSAFHIFENGRLNEANASKCPKTVELLAACPQPSQAGRTPTAMFSLLKPRTHIPAHTGVTNARVVAHLPLIIPEHCGFRVGNQTREWIPGKAWIFDDTIEHEAWNHSDKLRVVLIFDVWHPHLTPPERAMITAMAEAIDAFSAEETNFGL